ncbi:hypothetical protein BN1232_06407 [Mycobacterium lentiflavum]|uniref:Uncharacterized protein n=1 Tax=Mycobacterium lentiflavum TaxID=141349 RepID=A0A0E4H670_MYCLN|nr:hypothetical protein BN1232_06407 [Mycobacterium lentiflavum]
MQDPVRSDLRGVGGGILLPRKTLGTIKTN